MKTAIILLLLISFLADQVLQFKSVQLTKNKSTGMLAIHVLTWLAPMFVIGVMSWKMTTIVELMWAWPLCSAVIHFLSEWVLGRWADAMYHKNEMGKYLAISVLDSYITGLSTVMLFVYFFNRGLGF